MTDQVQPHDSVTIRAFSPSGYNVLITLRNGETMPRAMTALGWLEQNGFTPTPPKSPSTGSNGVPVCPVHGSPMAESKKFSGFYCPRKDDHGAYCKHTVTA